MQLIWTFAAGYFYPLRERALWKWQRCIVKRSPYSLQRTIVIQYQANIQEQGIKQPHGEHYIQFDSLQFTLVGRNWGIAAIEIKLFSPQDNYSELTVT